MYQLQIACPVVLSLYIYLLLDALSKTVTLCPHKMIIRKHSPNILRNDNKHGCKGWTPREHLTPPPCGGSLGLSYMEFVLNPIF